MTQQSRQLFPLWDFGWLDHSELRLPACRESQDVVAAYLSSDRFATSFVGPNEEKAPDLHGAFWRASIGVSDFLLISKTEFYDHIQAIRQPQGFSEPASDEQWQTGERVIAAIQPRYTWIMMLRLTEESEESFHEWGFVLTIFREFLLANPDAEHVSRLVFGYD